ncbi:putative hyoscyamine 6-dioxygenase-like [Capsicum annuum]|nr:putative hyoscyamine 6-dioxygenase-like [Capsicum annuum]
MLAQLVATQSEHGVPGCGVPVVREMGTVRVDGAESSLWEDFTNTFLDRLFPLELREVKAEKFVNLNQGKISVKKYALKFHQLSRYALEMVSDMRARMRKFTLRLSHELLLKSKVSLLIKDMDISRGFYDEERERCFNCGQPGLILRNILLEVGPLDPKGKFISYLRAQRLISKGCLYYLVRFKGSNSESPSLHSVPVVNEFLKVFLDDLPNVPIDKEIEFEIDLVLNTCPISISPYRWLQQCTDDFMVYCDTFRVGLGFRSPNLANSLPDSGLDVDVKRFWACLLGLLGLSPGDILILAKGTLGSCPKASGLILAYWVDYIKNKTIGILKGCSGKVFEFLEGLQGHFGTLRLGYGGGLWSIVGLRYPSQLGPSLGHDRIPVSCELFGIMINKAMKIINEWKYFYMRGGNLRDLFFPSLITMMLKGIDVPKEGGDSLEESNVPFNQLKVKGSQGRSKKKRKIGLGAEIAGSKRERSMVPLVSRPLYPFGT